MSAYSVLLFVCQWVFTQFGTAPDYGLAENWAALPSMKDSADAVPRNSDLIDGQDSALADVFFVHPTTFYSLWNLNADIDNKRVNAFTDRTAIRFQASVYNGSCRVYAPRYRQASLFAFLDKDNKQKALDLAYQDVKAAFVYYLEHYNQDRPIVIASHSQGTFHAARLIRDLFDNDQALAKRLVAAYLIGGPATDGSFATIPPCDSAAQTGCYITWNTMLSGSDPLYENCTSVNPLIWSRAKDRAGPLQNRGSVPRTFDRVDHYLVGAQSAANGALWIDKPPKNGYPGLRNFHLCDYSLFYVNIRENVKQRIDAWHVRNGK